MSLARPPRDIARWVIGIETAAIQGLLDQLDESFDRAVECLKNASGRVVCTGMGKSGIIMRKLAATLSSTGTPSLFLHPAEAIHGDLGMIGSGDVVIAASYSGSTEELVRLVELIQRLGVPLIAMTGNAGSQLARHADIHLRTEIDHEACPLNLAPTASTTAILVLGDALAMALLEARGFTIEDFARLHPGGRLGRQLLRVADVMHRDDALPKVAEAAPMREAIYEMSKKGLGITAVTDGDGKLLGCLSDGDLRRLLEPGVSPPRPPQGDGVFPPRSPQGDGDALLDRSAGDCMHPNPRTIGRNELASAALRLMEDHRITSLFVCDPQGGLEGVVHIHDLWRLELF